jgi:hypothetical protein
MYSENGATPDNLLTAVHAINEYISLRNNTFYVCDGTHFESKADAEEHGTKEQSIYGPYVSNGNYPKECETSPEYWTVSHPDSSKYDTKEEAVKAAYGLLGVQKRMNLEGSVRGPITRKYVKT